MRLHEQPAECEANGAHRRPARPSRAKRIKRVVGIDREHGPNCGGELKIIAAILEQPVIEKLLTHRVCRPGHHRACQPVARRGKRPEAAQP